MPGHTVDPNDPLPRYYQIYASLLERIQSGEFTPGSAIPTERELGDEYGVSRITVIKALDMLESEGLVERQQGRGTFVSGQVERALPAGSTTATAMLAFISFALGHPYLSSVLVGVARMAAQYGHPLHVFGSVDSSQKEAACIQEALARGVQGLIVYPWQEYGNTALYRDLQARGFPFVLVDRYYPDVLTDYVVFDDRRAGHELTSALLGKGHTRIAFVTHGEAKTTSTIDRLSGYRQALEEHGLAYDEDLVWLDFAATFTADGMPNSHLNEINELFRRHLEAERPTAVVAVNYDIAEALIYALHARYGDPQAARGNRDLEIATFSYKQLSPNTPFVSVVAMQSGDSLGAAAADVLVGRLSGCLPAELRHLHLPMEIVQLKQDSGPVF